MDWGLGLGLAGLFLDPEHLCRFGANRSKLYQPSQHLDRNKCLHKVILFQENPPKWQQQSVPEKLLKLIYSTYPPSRYVLNRQKDSVWRRRHSSYFGILGLGVLRSLCKDGSERRKSTGSEMFTWRLRNVQKSVMHVQGCFFANLNLLLFCRSR